MLKLTKKRKKHSTNSSPLIQCIMSQSGQTPLNLVAIDDACQKFKTFFCFQKRAIFRLFFV